ncbi:MAG: ATP-binding cassette domain-containing protein [Oscillospiraceae bacterium]
MSLFVDILKELDGFTLRVKISEESGVLGILGASGAGKSMTLGCIAGLIKPTSGKIVLNGRTLFDSEMHINLPPQKRNIGYLFQSCALFPNMTLLQNVGAGIKDKNRKGELCEKYIKLLQLGGCENRYPSQLSGGQKQRAALARCLAAEPELLLLDEPFSALDTMLKNDIEDEFLPLLNAFNGNVLYVSHNLQELYKASSRLCLLHGGHVVECGDTRKLFSAPHYVVSARLFGCRNFIPLSKTEQGVYSDVLNIIIPNKEGDFAGIYEKNLHVISENTAYIKGQVIAKICLPNKTILRIAQDVGTLYATDTANSPYQIGDIVGLSFDEKDIFVLKA